MIMIMLIMMMMMMMMMMALLMSHSLDCFRVILEAVGHEALAHFNVNGENLAHVAALQRLPSFIKD